jgi:hypothetical protein
VVDLLNKAGDTMRKGTPFYVARGAAALAF